MTDVIGDALRHHAAIHPDKPFIKVSGGEYSTFAQLNRRTDDLAAGFAQLGITKGDRVAMLAPNRAEVIEMYFALAKIGAVQVPLNTYLKGEFLRHQLANSDPSVFVLDHPGLLSSVELLSTLPSLHTVVTLDSESDPLAAELTASGQHRYVRYSEIAIDNGEPPAVELTGDDHMSIVYTSGTTGLPKGCLLTHGYYTRVGQQMNYANDTTPDDILFTALPLFHSAARMMVVSAALQAGAPLVIEAAFSARNFMRRAGEERATLAYGVGAYSVALLKSPPSEFDRSTRLRILMAPPTSKAMQDAFLERFGVRVWAESFGQTECVPVTNNPLRESLRRAGSCGLPAHDLDVVLLDAADNPVPQGEVGEVCVRPRNKNAMFAGYWRNPEATLEAFKHLWFHTGDTGYFDADGFFWFLDRKKDSIRRKGENVSSAELEAAISLHPLVDDVAVIGVPSDLSEEEIKAVIVLSSPGLPDAAELFDFFATHLPYYAIPRYVEFVGELPKNATGRVQKFRLKESPAASDVWDFAEMGHQVSLSARR